MDVLLSDWCVSVSWLLGYNYSLGIPVVQLGHRRKEYTDVLHNIIVITVFL